MLSIDSISVPRSFGGLAFRLLRATATAEALSAASMVNSSPKVYQLEAEDGETQCHERGARGVVYSRFPIMTFHDLSMIAPSVIHELAGEFVRRGDECLKADKTSQPTACILLALRSISLLRSMALLMMPSTRDSWDVLSRALLESTDLLMNFRFDDEGARQKIAYWFAGKTDSSWKADHDKCEQFLRRLGYGESELATRWSAMTTVSHPTLYAAQNSAKNVAGWITGPAKTESLLDTIVPKVADYLASISKLIVIATFDLPGWIPLGFDLSKIATADQFQRECAALVSPVLAVHQKITLPEGSYRSESDKAAKRAKLKKNPPV
jgi:hypothetical protein